MKNFIQIIYPIFFLNLNNKNILIDTITTFFSEYITHPSRKYFILLKIRYNNDSTYSLHKGVIITKNSLVPYLDFIAFQLSLKSEDYKNENEYSHIIFEYFEIPKDREDHFKESKWNELKSISIRKLKNILFDKYLLPINMNYLTWGEIYLNTEDLKIIIMKDKHFIISKKENSKYEIKMSSIKNKSIILVFYDQMLTKDGNRYFIRKIDKSIFYCDIVDEKILLALKTVKTSFLKTLSIKELPIPKIMTIDIETIVKDGIHKPYLYSLYDGKNAYSFFSDNASELLTFILKRKYDGYDVYAHNLSHFDIIFLLKEMAKLRKEFNFHFLKKENKFINIRIYNTKKKISINFKDSFLLLPSSLAKLSTQFNIENPKGTEPVYQGDLNSPYYMKDISHYNKKVDIFLNLDDWKSKIQSYCEGDCIALYEILIKFRTLIFSQFNVNIDTYPTTPSVAFAIFRTHFLQEKTIPLFKGKIMDFLRESFTGGSTDVYIPYGKNIYWYDVNSLYPSMMKQNRFPIGEIIHFQGNIQWLYQLEPSIKKEETYWIGEVNVHTKKNLYIPYLQISHISNIPKRTISPNGSFSMKINSCEYENALKDYNFEIKNGFLFESKDIFSNFVDTFYSLRIKYPKNDPMNYICKLIMNSLYGRFAMKPILYTISFIDRDLNIHDFIDHHDIIDHIDIDKDTILMTYSKKNTKIDDDPDFINSIAIASAVTAYSRVHMSKLKNQSDFKIYYSDTDSAFTDRPLDPSIVGNKLGQMKLENILKEGIFLGPKIYAGITDNNEYICKIKGFKNSKIVSMDMMKSLLSKDKNVVLNHTKWFRNMEESNIIMKDQIYDLMKTEYKREFIYNKEGVAIDTKAFFISNNKKVNTMPDDSL